MRKIIGDFSALVNSHDILGIIPLDLFLHFIIGAMITIFCLKRGFSLKKSFFILMGLALAKEIFDWSYAYPASWTEYTSDFLVSLLYFIILVIFRKFKNMIENPPKDNAQKIQLYKDKN